MTDFALIAFELLIVIVTGLALGSFATAIIYREPRGISWSFSRPSRQKTVGGEGAGMSSHRSACPSCGKTLKFRHLIPVFSWLVLRGKCGHCRHPVPLFYLLSELASVAAVLAVYAVYGLSLPGVFIIALVPFLMALLVIDLQHLILPNRLVLIVGVMGFLRLITEGFILETINPVLIGGNYILGAALYAGTAWLLGWIMTVVLRKDALGFGDVKFFAVAGLWLGVLKLADFCILSGILGVILALAWQQIKKEKVFPFGPALIIALFVLLLVDGSLFA